MSCGKVNQNEFSDNLLIMEKEPDFRQKTINSIGIYVDVTPSMEGFLGMTTENYKTLVEETRYMLCLDEIDKIIAGYDSNVITYYRVDTPLWKTKENVLKNAKKHNYYINSKFFEDNYEKIDLIEDDGEDYNSLCLTNAILNCKEDDFSVIITDFYENNKEASEVIRVLKEKKSISSDKTIGVIGIKSEYAGVIYDYNSKGIEYGVLDGTFTKDDICYRQFFVIVIGYSEIIQKFCQHMKENMNLSEEDIKYILFFEDKIYGLDYTNFNECHTRSNRSDYKLWPYGTVKINEKIFLDVFDYSNKRGIDRDVVVSYSVEGSALIKELQKGKKCLVKIPDIEEKELIEVPYYIEKNEISSWRKEENCYIENTDLVNLFYIENVFYSQEDELLYIWFKISSKDLPPLSLKLGCQIYLNKVDDIEEEWVEEWNIENNEIDYEKTKNLKEYFNAMKPQVLEKNRVLLNFVFYINCQ